MNDIFAEIMGRAENMGIQIYYQDGQIKVEIPWQPGSIPDPARYILGELKSRRGELLVYFVLTTPPTDVQLYLDALNAWGTALAPDKENGIRIKVPPLSARNNEVLAKLLDKPLKDYWHLILGHLASSGVAEQPG